MDLELEKEIIKKCSDDLNAFTEIYNVYSKDIYRFAYSMIKDQHIAEDIMSETFIKALQGVKKYRFIENRSIKIWLIRICRNLVYDRYKKKVERLEYTSYDDSLSHFDESIFDKVANKDLIKEINNYIMTFEDIEREILDLRLWQEISFAEIAHIMNKSEGAVKMSFGRSIKKIKIKFNEERNHNG